MIVKLPTSSTSHAIIDVWIPILVLLFLLFAQSSDRCSRMDLSDLKKNNPYCISAPEIFSPLYYMTHLEEIQKIVYLLSAMKICVYNTPSGTLDNKMNRITYNTIFNPDVIDGDTYSLTIKNRGDCGMKR